MLMLKKTTTFTLQIKLPHMKLTLFLHCFKYTMILNWLSIKPACKSLFAAIQYNLVYRQIWLFRSERKSHWLHICLIIPFYMLNFMTVLEWASISCSGDGPLNLNYIWLTYTIRHTSFFTNKHKSMVLWLVKTLQITLSMILTVWS